MKERKAAKRKIKNPVEDRILYAVVYTIIILFLIAILYPVIFIISSSFSDGEALQRGEVLLLPVKPTLEGYKAVFNHGSVMIGYRNTIFYTVFGTIINVAMTVICAYPLSRRDMPFRGFFMLLFVITMFFGGGLIPMYLLVNSLGLMNTEQRVQGAAGGGADRRLLGREVFLRHPAAAVEGRHLGYRPVLRGGTLEFLLRRADLYPR